MFARTLKQGASMRILPAVVALVMSAGVAIADPVGKYGVSGTNPSNGSRYSGEVQVERTNETFRVTWTISGQRYVGTAIGNDEFIAVSYRSGNDTGLALYGKDGDAWKGIWTYAGGQKVGTEIWERR
jgi:hypothetical protein